MLLSALVGMLLAPHPNPWLVCYGLIGIALASASGAVVNHLVDRHYDAAMQRTHRRPIPQHRVTPKQAGVFAALLLTSSMAILYGCVNLTATWLTLATMIGYAWLYTHYLKHTTPQNIVIGGLSGALPPLLGWVCITATITPEPLLLVLLIFVWTPPHFWALAIDRLEDYKHAKLPMLPVTHGVAYTERQIILYTILTAMVSFIPIFTGMFGALYGWGMALLNIKLMWLAWQCPRSNDALRHRTLFYYSIQYLMGAFVLMLLDHFWRF